MTTRAKLALWCLMLLILSAALWRAGWLSGSGNNGVSEIPKASGVDAGPSRQNNAAQGQRLAPRLPDDSRPAVQAMYQLARIAAFYNFEPQVTGYEERTNGSLRSILFETRSHIVEVFNGKVMLAVSAMDGANPPHDPGRGGTKDWHQCTGQWSEDEIVNDTLRILRESNDTNVLNAISSGKRQVQAVPITVKDPAGRDVRVTPFPTVRLYDTNLTLRVIAEYRLGPTGIAGLTAWTSR